MIVPSNDAANSSASADLPLAVGPAMTMTGGSDKEGVSRLADIMTLIAGPDGAGALPGVVDALDRTLPLAASPDWLALNIACDVALAETDATAAEAVARRAIGDAAIDVVVQ